jgi:hypothetical protein
MATKSAVRSVTRGDAVESSIQCRRRLLISERRKARLGRPVRGGPIGKNADAIAALPRTVRRGERQDTRPKGARPRVRHERQRDLVDAWRQRHAELLSVPEGQRVADRGERELPREFERFAIMPRVSSPWLTHS